MIPRQAQADHRLPGPRRNGLDLPGVARSRRSVRAAAGERRKGIVARPLLGRPMLSVCAGPVSASRDPVPAMNSQAMPQHARVAKAATNSTSTHDSWMRGRPRPATEPDAPHSGASGASRAYGQPAGAVPTLPLTSTASLSERDDIGDAVGVELHEGEFALEDFGRSLEDHAGDRRETIPVQG